jgi:hypothetical protein
MSGNRAFPRKKSESQKKRDRLKRLEERQAANFHARAIKIDKWKRNTEPISKKTLSFFYFKKNKSMKEIADALKCSPRKVAYWMEKYKIPRRGQSEAIYLKNNPDGDPFKFRPPQNIEEAKLFGMGLGLYWGEGTKSNKNTIRLSNTDPNLIKAFIRFLVDFGGIKKNDLKFGLQVFSDVSPEKALEYWYQKLKVKKSQFQKVIVTPSRGKGTYRRKLKYGVLTVHYNNKKLRNIVGKELSKYGFVDKKPE